MSSVLVVEDEPRIAAFVARALQARGHAVTVVGTGGQALAILGADGGPVGQVDLVLLDLGLPDMDGTEVLRRLRSRGTGVPVIALTAREEVQDRVRGLDLGADDYLVKPFALDELAARVRARLRGTRRPATVLRGGGVELDLLGRTARPLASPGAPAGADGAGGTRVVDLTAKEFSLAETLLRHPGQVLSRDQLHARVWGLHHDPGSNVVEVYVGYLRRKLGTPFVETVRGVGYRLGR